MTPLFHFYSKNQLHASRGFALWSMKLHHDKPSNLESRTELCPASWSTAILRDYGALQGVIISTGNECKILKNVNELTAIPPFKYLVMCNQSKTTRLTLAFDK